MSQPNQLELLIEQAKAAGADRGLRIFAVWCAMQTEESGVQWAHVIDLAEQYALGEASYSELEAVGRSISNAASAAALIGLKNNAPNAATLLAAVATLKPDAADAARQAADLHCRWVLMRARAKGVSYERLEMLEEEILAQQVEEFNILIHQGNDL